MVHPMHVFRKSCVLQNVFATWERRNQNCYSVRILPNFINLHIYIYVLNITYYVVALLPRYMFLPHTAIIRCRLSF
jgi:hypothetical protein